MEPALQATQNKKNKSRLISSMGQHSYSLFFMFYMRALCDVDFFPVNAKIID